MKALLALLLLLPSRARAFDSSPECNESGYNKTSAACQDPTSDRCYKRLDKTIQKCMKKMDKAGDDPAVVAERLNALLLIEQKQKEAEAAESQAPGDNSGAAAPGSKGAGRGGPGGKRRTADDQSPDEDKAAPAADTILKGKQALQKSDPKAARNAADDVLDDDPKNLDALQLRAQAKLAQGDAAGAAKDAREMLSIDPQNQFAHLMLDANKDISESALKRALKRPDFGGSESADGGAGRGKSLGQANGPGAGSSVGSGIQMKTGAQTAATALVQSALAKLRMRDLTGALDEAGRAIAADPANPSAWAARATIWNQLGKPESALKDADEALKLDPANVAALLERGYAKYQLGQYKDALVDIEKALSLDPLNAMGYLYKGMVLEKLERAEEAAKAYLRAADLDGALKPLVDEALARLGFGPKSAGGGAARKSPQKLWLLGGAFLFALGLLFMGVKRAVKPEWATPSAPPTPKTPPTPVR